MQKVHFRGFLLPGSGLTKRQKSGITYIPGVHTQTCHLVNTHTENIHMHVYAQSEAKP